MWWGLLVMCVYTFVSQTFQISDNKHPLSPAPFALIPVCAHDHACLARHTECRSHTRTLAWWFRMPGYSAHSKRRLTIKEREKEQERGMIDHQSKREGARTRLLTTKEIEKEQERESWPPKKERRSKKETVDHQRLQVSGPGMHHIERRKNIDHGKHW